MDTARKRILHFVEIQDISPKDFTKKTGLKRGFLDKSHQNSGASDIFLSKILEAYPKLNAHWLLTGNGEMEVFENQYANETEAQYATKSDVIINRLDAIDKKLDSVALLKQEIDDLKEVLHVLAKIESTNNKIDNKKK